MSTVTASFKRIKVESPIQPLLGGVLVSLEKGEHELPADQAQLLIDSGAALPVGEAVKKAAAKES